ncbi:steroid 17-alpha-hydroxylase/17,20 lyase-like [Haliotis rufescens]|uniref:steroid 17-alpha-hydroxylase/17,20 lyase-like n=1 Tax=Haliotis rufescens TaxID=6454 RepID=UPI00201ECDB5|nr:steroid 17-alpha-hydroxylase/17,20 lyase-like [Haliotis rufescens]XP_046343157.2 steroid 17-alpha-hydroxylase/17,20 lyase-like [Haliotis rufescens]
MGGTLESLSAIVLEYRTTLILGLGLAVMVYLMNRKRHKLPPGPRGLPLLGNILAIQNVSLYRKLSQWEKQFGPVMTLHLGPVSCVFLNNVEAVQEAFVQKAVAFAGRPMTFSGKAFTEGGKDIAFTDYGATWQLHRKLALRALKYYMKGEKFQDTIVEVMEAVAAEMETETEPFDIYRYINLAIFNIISKICFDEKFSSDNEEFLEFCKGLDTFSEEVGNGFLEDVFPPIRLYPTAKFRKFMKIQDSMLGFIYKRINVHKETFSSDTQRDFTDAMLIAQKEAEAEENPELLAQITNTHLGQTVSDVFQAGVDTSRQTLHWTILYLAAHPEVQAKLHAEVDSVIGQRRVPMLSERHKLPYTEAVLYESMRMATVAPLSLPHSTTCDTTLGDYEIPKGTMVMANLFAIHHDPRHWKEPEVFNPERFLDDSGRFAPKPESWMPFSVGKRSCMAEALAKPELHLLLASFMRSFEIRLPDGVTPDLEPQGSFTCLPKRYKVVIKNRLV